MARQMIDIGLDAGGDVNIVNSKLTWVESTFQHQKDLLISDKGSYLQNPTICVGLPGYLENDNPGEVIREIKTEFTRDGMQIIGKVTLTNPIAAFYP